MRRAISALVVGAALLAAPAAVAQEAVEVDQDAILAPAAEDSPTPTPEPSPTATVEATGERVVVTRSGGDNAALQPVTAKEQEAESDCLANPSRLLAVGGSEKVGESRSWAWLPFLIAAVCAALVASAYTLRRRRDADTGDKAPPSLLEVAATIVAICAGVAGLAAQFVPGVGVEERPAPSAEMKVRTVNARVTRGQFARRIGAERPRSAVDRREVGNVIWLELELAGYRGQRLDLQWGSYESKPGGPLVAATTHQIPVEVDDDSDEQTLFQPVWVGYPSLKRFHVQFRLLQGGEVREIASTRPMRGNVARYSCRRD